MNKIGKLMVERSVKICVDIFRKLKGENWDYLHHGKGLPESVHYKGRFHESQVENRYLQSLQSSLSITIPFFQ